MRVNQEVTRARARGQGNRRLPVDNTERHVVSFGVHGEGACPVMGWVLFLWLSNPVAILSLPGSALPPSPRTMRTSRHHGYGVAHHTTHRTNRHTGHIA